MNEWTYMKEGRIKEWMNEWTYMTEGRKETTCQWRWPSSRRWWCWSRRIERSGGGYTGRRSAIRWTRSPGSTPEMCSPTTMNKTKKSASSKRFWFLRDRYVDVWTHWHIKGASLHPKIIQYQTLPILIGEKSCTPIRNVTSILHQFLHLVGASICTFSSVYNYGL